MALNFTFIPPMVMTHKCKKTTSNISHFNNRVETHTNQIDWQMHMTDRMFIAQLFDIIVSFILWQFRLWHDLLVNSSLELLVNGTWDYSSGPPWHSGISGLLAAAWNHLRFSCKFSVSDKKHCIYFSVIGWLKLLSTLSALLPAFVVEHGADIDSITV